MSRKKRTFSKPFNEALIHAELIQEMMIEDGWSGLDETVLRANKKALAIFTRHAEAALRVLKRIEEREANLKPSDMD